MTKTSIRLHKIVAVGLIIFPLLVNEWTLMYFLGDYIGEGFSNHINLFLCLLMACSLSLGIAILRSGPEIVHELWIILLLLMPVFVTRVYLFCSAGGVSNASDFFYGELLNISIVGVLTLLFFRGGIFISFVILSLLSFVDFIYFRIYDSLITPPVFFEVFETNLREAFGFLGRHLFSFSTMVFAIVFLLACWLLFKITARVNRKRISLYLLILCISFLLPLSFQECRKVSLPHNLLFKLVRGHQEYNRLYEEIYEFSNKSLEEIESITFSQPPPREELHVVVIGGSADRDHMGIYGYNRDTTDILSKMSDELFVFSDVISVHLNGAANMEKMLTFANYENEDSSREKGSLIHYLRKAGYETYWISNQSSTEPGGIMAGSLAKACDSVSFVNYSENLKQVCLDDKILPVFQSVLSQSTHNRKFVFIHLAGSQKPAEIRYPPEYSRFTGDIGGKTKKQIEEINHYDNSIVYSDHIVSEIIEMVRETNIYASVIYTSDHGLEVYDKGNHFGYSLVGGLEVPFILWLSGEYKALNIAKITNFNRYLDRKYTSDDMLFSICDLLNLRFDSFQSHRSIFSESFKPRKRSIGMPDKETMWDYDAGLNGITEKSKAFFKSQPEDIKEKVWAHRANSIDKLVSASEIFYGIEFDVMFDWHRKLFDVRHSPGRTNHYSLDEHWGGLDNPQDLHFWVDFKNLGPENQGASLQRLLYLSDKYKIPRENILVESKVPLPLTGFKEKGFFTSYWINTGFLKNDTEKNFGDLNKSKRRSLEKIKKDIKRSRVDAISFPITLLDVASNFLHEIDNINLWTPELVFDNEKDMEEVKQVLNSHPRVKTFLVELPY